MRCFTGFAETVLANIEARKPQKNSTCATVVRCAGRTGGERKGRGKEGREGKGEGRGGEGPQ
jgi:hypothetical protein